MEKNSSAFHQIIQEKMRMTPAERERHCQSEDRIYDSNLQSKRQRQVIYKFWKLRRTTGSNRDGCSGWQIPLVKKQDAGIFIVLLWVGNFTGITTESVGMFYIYCKKYFGLIYLDKCWNIGDLSPRMTLTEIEWLCQGKEQSCKEFFYDRSYLSYRVQQFV